MKGLPLDIPHRWAETLIKAQEEGEPVNKLADAAAWLVDHEIVSHEEMCAMVSVVLGEYVEAAEGMLNELGMGRN